MKLGRAIAAARHKAGLSQADLAKELDVSTGTVAAWELDEHGIRMSRIDEVARALKTTVRSLMAKAA